MCRRINCSKCEKYTWAGCGLHIQTALAGLSEDEICQCNKQDASKEADATSASNDNGIFSKIKSAIGM